MESDEWSRFSAVALKLHESALQLRYADTSRNFSLRGRSDLFRGSEVFDRGQDDPRVEFTCPFCFEDFDIVGLFCHIDDEHPAEAKNGVCPVCAANIGPDFVAHITTQHRNFFKMQHRRQYHKGSSSSHTMLSLLRKDLRDGNLQALLGRSSFVAPPLPMAAPDPFISSLIYTLPLDEASKDLQPECFSEGSHVNKSSDEKVIESHFCGKEMGLVSRRSYRGIWRWFILPFQIVLQFTWVKHSLSDKDQKERAGRSEFVQGLVLTTIFDGTL